MWNRNWRKMSKLSTVTTVLKQNATLLSYEWKYNKIKCYTTRSILYQLCDDAVFMYLLVCHLIRIVFLSTYFTYFKYLQQKYAHNTVSGLLFGNFSSTKWKKTRIIIKPMSAAAVCSKYGRGVTEEGMCKQYAYIPQIIPFVFVSFWLCKDENVRKQLIYDALSPKIQLKNINLSK